MQYTEFLNEHLLNPELIHPGELSDTMVNSIRAGLSGKPIDIPMIPTYLSMSGSIPQDTNAVVIDAGGTNFRSALVSFSNGEFIISEKYSAKMPGTDSPATWDEFISFTANSIEPFMDKADIIGFCFSYSAHITPEMDAVVDTIDKEVCITGCEGKKIASSLLSELESRGIYGKKCVILNDTVAALLGGISSVTLSDYSDYMGLICGTGFNICSIHNNMIYNQETGFYSCAPSGDIDEILDSESLQPGEKLIEKKCSGAYIGRIAALALGREGDLGGAAVSDMCINGTDLEKAVCLAITERSAKFVASAIIAVLKYNKTGIEKPALVCAEGSLVAKSPVFLDYLKSAIKEGAPDRSVIVNIGNGTTLSGSAVAALLNI